MSARRRQAAGEPHGLPIVAPSFMRAGYTTSQRAFPPGELIFCVAEFEADAYREALPDNEIVTHPDDVVGLSATRQWMYDHWGDLIMVDDDIDGLIHFEHKTGDRFERDGRMYSQHHLTPEENALVLWRLADEAREAGVFLFGINASGDPRNYKCLAPYKMTGYVDGSAYGMLRGSKLFHTKEIVAAVDHWLSGLNAFYHRRCLIDNRYGVVQARETGNFRNPGGASVWRTEETEVSDTEVLRKYFGKKVFPPHAGTERARTMSAGQRGFSLPF